MRTPGRYASNAALPGFLFLGVPLFLLRRIASRKLITLSTGLCFAAIAQLLLFAVGSGAQNATAGSGQKLRQEFQSAVNDYNAGNLTAAADQLEKLLPRSPASFEAHELLGLVYARESREAKAREQLEIAVKLKPDSAAARTNLATNLAHAGQLTQAIEQFKKAIAIEPQDFDANHDLGEVYVQGGKIGEALPFLEKAQQLRPSAYNNSYDLAQAYLLTGQLDEARSVVQSIAAIKDAGELHNLLGQIDEKDGKFVEAANEFATAARMDPSEDNLFTWGSEQFKKAIAIEPQDFDANHDLGEVYVQGGKIGEALPFLEKAQQLRPSAYNNSYDLAQAYFLTGQHDEARSVVQSIAAIKDAGELHNLLGQIDEKDGKFVEAANEFATAARMDPSEDNLFTWGSELLLHRTYEPAIAVFQKAAERYPTSPRLLIGLGMAFYSLSRYEESIKALLAAADLNPNDARCYLFLSKAYLSSPKQAEDVIERFHRYAELQPTNGLAQYYYAMSLWKGKRLEQSGVDFQAIEALLRKAIAADGKLADAHLQLGILYADQHQYDKALPEYQRALALNPDLPDAHYRLGQYFVHAGQKDEAQKQFDVYQQEQAQYHAAIDKERAEVQQFVYSAKPAPANNP